MIHTVKAVITLVAASARGYVLGGLGTLYYTDTVNGCTVKGSMKFGSTINGCRGRTRVGLSVA